MPFALLYSLLPEVAKAETRCVLDREHNAGIAFREMFCDEPGCDCRRVLFQVTPVDDGDNVLATISYGWEPDSFYREWAGFPLEDHDLEELRGPGLMRTTPQSEHAHDVLDICRELLTDDAYRERIVRHYRMFRRIVESGGARRRRVFPGWHSMSSKHRKRK